MALEKIVEKLGFAETPGQIFWSYDDKPFSLRTSPEQIYLERPAFGLSSKPHSIREEAVAAARDISRRFPNPTILYSGGVDSEVVVLSFFLQKIPFQVLIVDYNGLNEHDIFRAKKFCQDLGIPYRTITRDIYSFWENDLESVATKVHCPSPQVAAHCWMVTQIDEYVIVGDGDSTLMRAHRQFFETKSERWALARWMLLHEKAGCPRFFQYSPGLESSFYFEPLVEQFVAGAWEFFEFRKFMYLKPFIFHKHFGCDLRSKLTGFENMGICDEYRLQLAALGISSQDISWTFENARKWALQKEGPQNWVHLQDSHIPEIEQTSLCQNGIQGHLIWTG